MVPQTLPSLTPGTVAGLPQSDNMLFAIGLRLNDRGVMSIDEKKLSEKVEDNFAAVADIFRAKGASDNPGAAYVGMNKETQISPDGYKVDVTRVPTRGTFTGQKLPGLIRIDKTNNTLLIKNNGRTSDPIELREDLYTPASLAKAIQKQIAEDKTLGSRGLRVEEHEGALRFTSGSFGSNREYFIASAADLLVAAGFEPNLRALEIVLPVGISFYTFQTLSYTIDVYRGKREPGKKSTIFQ